MAFEKNINDMKILFLILMGIPLIVSTNIDCSGKSFHCLNSTHFMICVDLGGGVSYTVDDFVIPCPPPTVCMANNRFECDLPPITTRAPTTAQSVKTPAITKQKEATVEDIIVDSISWSTGPEQHLELSSAITQEPTIDATVIPFQPVKIHDKTEIYMNKNEVTTPGALRLTTVSDQVITNIDVKSATTSSDLLQATPDTLLENTNISFDSGFIVTSNINENIIRANKNGTEKLREVNNTTVINLGFEANVNETDFLNYNHVHSNVMKEYDQISVTTPENDIRVSNVQGTSGSSLVQRSAPTTESVMLNDTSNLTKYEILFTDHTLITTTDIQPSSKIDEILKSNVLGTEPVDENYITPTSGLITTESVTTANKTVFSVSKTFLKSAVDNNLVSMLENTTNTSITTKNTMAKTKGITNFLVTNRTEIQNILPESTANVSDTFFDINEAPLILEVAKNQSNSVNIASQYSASTTVSLIAVPDQGVTKETTMFSTVSKNKQNDMIVDVGSTLTTESMGTSVLKSISNKTENDDPTITFPIMIIDSIDTVTDATIQNTRTKEDQAFKENSDVINRSLYTTPNYLHENKHFTVELSKSNLKNQNQVLDIRTEFVSTTEGIENKYEVTNDFVTMTESELIVVNPDTDKLLFRNENISDLDMTTFALDANTENILSVSKTNTDIIDIVDLANNSANRVQIQDLTDNSTLGVQKQENELITTESTVLSFLPQYTIKRSSDDLDPISSNLETADEKFTLVTTFDDRNSIADISINDSTANWVANPDFIGISTPSLLKQEKETIVTTENTVSLYLPVTSRNLEIADENFNRAVTFDDKYSVTDRSVNDSSITMRQTEILEVVTELASPLNTSTEKQVVITTTSVTDSKFPVEEKNNTILNKVTSENGSDQNTEQNNAINTSQNNELKQITLTPSMGQNNTVLNDMLVISMASPNLHQNNYINILQNGVNQQVTTSSTTGQSDDMILYNDGVDKILSAPSTEPINILNIPQNNSLKQTTSPSMEQSNMNTPLNSVDGSSSEPQGKDQNTLINDVVQQITLSSSTEQSYHTNTGPNSGVEQNNLTPSMQKINAIETVAKDKLKQNMSAPGTQHSNTLNTIQNGGTYRSTSVSDSEQNNDNNKLQNEPITWAPGTEQSNVITTIRKGGLEQPNSASSTEQSNIMITARNYGFEPITSVLNTEKSKTKNDKIEQIITSSGTEKNYAINILFNNEDEQNKTSSSLQNSGVEPTTVFSSTEQYNLITDDDTMQYSRANQMRTVLGIKQSNHTIIVKDGTAKGSGVDFDNKRNITISSKQIASINYSEVSTVINPLSKTDERLNDYSNSEQSFSTNVPDSDVTENIRLLSSSRPDSGPAIVNASKADEAFIESKIKNNPNSLQTTNISEQSTGSTVIELIDNMTQSGTTNTIQNIGIEQTGPLNFSGQSSVINVIQYDGENADSQTKLEQGIASIVTKVPAGQSEYLSNSGKIESINETIAAVTVTTEFSHSNDLIVTLSVSTNATTPKATFERFESGSAVAREQTVSLKRTVPGAVMSDPNPVHSSLGSEKSVLVDNTTEIDKQENVHTVNNVVIPMTYTNTKTKLSGESQQIPQMNVTFAEEDQNSKGVKGKMSISENLSIAVTSIPLEAEHNDLAVTSTSSNMEVIQNTHIPLVVEVTTQMTATYTENFRTPSNLDILGITTAKSFRAKDSIKTADNERKSNSTEKLFDCRTRATGKYAYNNDCNKFYVCSGTSQSIIGKCPINTVFSEIRRQCTSNLSHCIRNNEFKCTTVGRFADLLKPNVFYICVKKDQTYLRYKLQCQNGYLLNTLTVTCYKNLVPESQSISNDNSQSTTEKISKEKESVSKKNKKLKVFECTDEGKFANPYNCRGYYICKLKNKSDETYYRKYKKCDQDEVFHKEKNKCVDASSYECRYCDSLSLNIFYVRVTRGHHFLTYKLECQAGYYLNTTVVRCDKISDVTNATDVKNVSRNILHEDNSNSRKNNKRFKCQKEGKFLDPIDSRRYYICTEKNNSERSEQIIFRRKHKKCKKHEVFNAEIQACA